jgi:hypothetical protein
MIPVLNELAEVLEEEIAVGGELLHNLAAQRQALVAWDMETLLARIEAREAWIRALGELEARRIGILDAQVASKRAVNLSQLIVACGEDLLARQRLQAVRSRARETFLRLQADERDLNGLMENLQSHLQEALKPLVCSSVPLYGDTGAAAPQFSLPALLHSKA